MWALEEDLRDLGAVAEDEIRGVCTMQAEATAEAGSQPAPQTHRVLVAKVRGGLPPWAQL